MDLLLQELFFTILLAVLSSFLIAKLVSLGGGDDKTRNSDLSDSQIADCQGNTNRDIDQTITEDLLCNKKLEVERLESGKRLDFVKDSTQKVYELSEISMQENDDTEIETEECSVQNQNDVVKESEEEINKKIEIVESDDDWEGIERSDVEKMFAKAAKFVESCSDMYKEGSLGMELYGLYKIATEGPCQEQPPLALKVALRAKWNAWQRLGNMYPEAAMEQFITLVSDRFPGWLEDEPLGDEKPGSAEEADSGALISDSTMPSLHHPNITEEKNGEAMPGTLNNNLTGEPELESAAKE